MAGEQNQDQPFPQALQMPMQASQRSQLPQLQGLPSSQADGSHNQMLAQRQMQEAVTQQMSNQSAGQQDPQAPGQQKSQADPSNPEQP